MYKSNSNVNLSSVKLVTSTFVMLEVIGQGVGGLFAVLMRSYQLFTTYTNNYRSFRRSNHIKRDEAYIVMLTKKQMQKLAFIYMHVLHT